MNWLCGNKCNPTWKRLLGAELADCAGRGRLDHCELEGLEWGRGTGVPDIGEVDPLPPNPCTLGLVATDNKGLAVFILPRSTTPRWSWWDKSNLLLGINNKTIRQYGLKVHIFWESHKILRNLPPTFDCMYYSQKLGEDFAKFCGLLRIYEL